MKSLVARLFQQSATLPPIDRHGSGSEIWYDCESPGAASRGSSNDNDTQTNDDALANVNSLVEVSPGDIDDDSTPDALGNQHSCNNDNAESIEHLSSIITNDSMRGGDADHICRSLEHDFGRKDCTKDDACESYHFESGINVKGQNPFYPADKDFVKSFEAEKALFRTFQDSSRTPEDRCTAFMNLKLCREMRLEHSKSMKHLQNEYYEKGHDKSKDNSYRVRNKIWMVMCQKILFGRRKLEERFYKITTVTHTKQNMTYKELLDLWIRSRCLTVTFSCDGKIARTFDFDTYPDHYNVFHRILSSLEKGATWTASYREIELPPSDLGRGDDTETEEATEETSGEVEKLSAMQSVIQAPAQPKSNASSKRSREEVLDVQVKKRRRKRGTSTTNQNPIPQNLRLNEEEANQAPGGSRLILNRMASIDSGPNDRTCLPDAIMRVLPNGCDQESLRADLLSSMPKHGDTRKADVATALGRHSLVLTRVAQKYQQPGGYPYHLFKEHDCHLILRIKLTNRKKESVHHFVAWDGSTIYDHPYMSKVNQTTDRRTPESSKKVFTKMYSKEGFTCQITNIYSLDPVCNLPK